MNLPSMEGTLARSSQRRSGSLPFPLVRCFRAVFPNVAYHLAILALEEIGKGGMIASRAAVGTVRDTDWIEKKFDDHVWKLQWAVWSPALSGGRIDPQGLIFRTASAAARFGACGFIRTEPCFSRSALNEVRYASTAASSVGEITAAGVNIHAGCHQRNEWETRVALKIRPVTLSCVSALAAFASPLR